MGGGLVPKSRVPSPNCKAHTTMCEVRREKCEVRRDMAASLHRCRLLFPNSHHPTGHEASIKAISTIKHYPPLPIACLLEDAMELDFPSPQSLSLSTRYGR